jgi:hypothetical protein
MGRRAHAKAQRGKDAKKRRRCSSKDAKYAKLKKLSLLSVLCVFA